MNYNFSKQIGCPSDKVTELSSRTDNQFRAMVDSLVLSRKDAEKRMLESLEGGKSVSEGCTSNYNFVRRGKAAQGKRKNGKGKVRYPVVGPAFSAPATSNPFPNYVDVILHYPDQNALGTAGLVVQTKAYQINCAFDVNPSLGSTATPGFSEWAAMYQFYRVVGVQVKLQLANKEAFPQNVIMGFQNTDPALINLRNYVGNKWTWHKLVSAAAAGRPVIQFTTPMVKIVDIVGSENPEFDDEYASTVSTVPTNKVFWGLSLDAGGSVFVNGVFYQLEVLMQTRFYERLIKTS